MTAVIIPITRAVAIVPAAYAILRSPADHPDDVLIEACTAIDDYADARLHFNERLQADIVQSAVAKRRRAASQPRPAPASPGLIRGALFETAVFVVAFGAVVFWVLAQRGM